MMSINESKAITVMGVALLFMILAIPYVNCAAETDLEKRMRQAGEAHKAQEQKEKMRDTSHDRRIKTGKDSSTGVDFNNGTPTVNVKKTFK
jgi:hypothetical protein